MYRYSNVIPLSNAVSAELVLGTGALDLWIADVQDVFPAIMEVANCFKTTVITTSDSARLPGAERYEYDHHHSNIGETRALAEKIVLRGIKSFQDRQGIPVYIPPYEVEAEVGFSVKDGKIRYGLSAVKGVGRSAAEQIILERKNGPFRNFEDLVQRLSQRGINRRAMESFIHAGAFDNLEGNRREKLVMLPEVLEDLQKGKKDQIAGQMSLLDLLGEEAEERQEFELIFPDLEEFPKAELLRNEKDALGVYLSGHPLDSDRALLKQVCTRRARDFSLEVMEEENRLSDMEQCTVGGMITGINRRITKKNDMMAFVTLEDNTGSMEVVVFPKTYELTEELIQEDKKVFVYGRVQMNDEANGKLIAEKIIAFENLPKEIWLQFSDKEAYLEKEKEVLECLSQEGGESTVAIYLRKEKAIKRLGKLYAVQSSQELLENLAKIVGSENVKEQLKSLKNA